MIATICQEDIDRTKPECVQCMVSQALMRITGATEVLFAGWSEYIVGYKNGDREKFKMGAGGYKIACLHNERHYQDALGLTFSFQLPK